MPDPVSAAWRVFDPLFGLWMRGRIREVRLFGIPAELPRDVPLLLCPNHVSWWDGFLVRRLQRSLRAGAPLRTVMLEHELRRNPLLRALGGLGLQPGSLASVRGAARRLAAYAEEHPTAVAVLFPQGTIWPTHRRPLGFLPGVRLFRRLLDPVWTLPVALHLEFVNRPAATAFVAVGEPIPPGPVPAPVHEILEDRVRGELDRIHRLLCERGEAALRASGLPPGRTTTLPGGPAPAGGAGRTPPAPSGPRGLLATTAGAFNTTTHDRTVR
jgi:1-acyl-sn-glycerol-3-phosphate acyltransferase